MAKEKKSRVNINNKRASFDYEFLETYTAGIVLVGTEIKSIRAGRASMSDAFCFFEKGQLYVRGINIALYAWGSWGQHAPLRDRKLLLQKRELPAEGQGEGPHYRCCPSFHGRERLRQAEYRSCAW